MANLRRHPHWQSRIFNPTEKHKSSQRVFCIYWLVFPNTGLSVDKRIWIQKPRHLIPVSAEILTGLYGRTAQNKLDNRVKLVQKQGVVTY